MYVVCYRGPKEARNNGLLFVLNRLAKCQTYFMLLYSAYASVCHVNSAKSRSASFRFVSFSLLRFALLSFSCVSAWVCFFGPYLLLGEFEFERQTFGRCTVVNSFVKRCAHKICALFMALNVESIGERETASIWAWAWELASQAQDLVGAWLGLGLRLGLWLRLRLRVELSQLLAVPLYIPAALPLLSSPPQALWVQQQRDLFATVAVAAGATDAAPAEDPLLPRKKRRLATKT